MGERLKYCKKCKRYLTLSYFHYRKDSKSNRRSHCRDCINTDNLERYYKANKKDIRKASYRYNLKINYNLSEEAYNKMYLEQKGCCAICERQLANRFLNIEGLASVVDHCHKTGRNRQLLCGKCNNGLGSFEDDLTILKKAIVYIEKHSI